jgi:hypothetical protein
MKRVRTRYLHGCRVTIFKMSEKPVFVAHEGFSDSRNVVHAKTHRRSRVRKRKICI